MHYIKILLIPVFFLILNQGLSSQEPENGNEIEITSIHMLGINFSQSYKTMFEMIDSLTVDIPYNITLSGLHYANFTGDRLGYSSDVYISYPFQSAIDSQPVSNSGIALDYYGAVAWNLQAGPFAFIPSVGFHADYMYLSKDPIDENKGNHMFSFGLAAGMKGLVNISEKKYIYLGLNAAFNTIEFSSASYDRREINLKRKLSYHINSGFAFRI